MARKRRAPKPPAAIPFPDDSPDDMAGMLGGLTAIMASVWTKRVVLLRSHVVADPDADAFGEAGTVSLAPPESEYQYDPKTRRLQVACHYGLTASPGPTKGRKKQDAAPLLTVETTFLIEYDVGPGVGPEPDDETLDFLSAAGIGHTWPYWREFVRDASTRAGLPVIDMPFEVEE